MSRFAPGGGRVTPTPGGGGTGDVVGPNGVGAVGDVAVYADTTGKLIGDSTLRVAGGSVTASLPLALTDGSAGYSTGSAYFASYPGTGIATTGEGNIQLFGAGSPMVDVGPDAIATSIPYSGADLPELSDPAAYQFANSSPQTGLYAPDPENVAIKIDGADALKCNAVETRSYSPIVVPPGSTSTAAGIIFSGSDSTTGLLAPVTNTVATAISGNVVLNVGATSIDASQPIKVADGTLLAPSIAIASQASTGFCKTPLNSFSISATCNGAEMMRISTNFLSLFNYGLVCNQSFIAVSTSIPIIGGFPNWVYFCTNTSAITLTIPDSTTVEDGFHFQVYSATANQVNISLTSASDSIVVGSVAPSAGTGIKTTTANSCVHLFLQGTTFYALNYIGTFVSQ